MSSEAGNAGNLEDDDFDVSALMAQINKNFGLDRPKSPWDAEESQKGENNQAEESNEGEKNKKKFEFTEFITTSEKKEDTFENSAIANLISMIPFVNSHWVTVDSLTG